MNENSVRANKPFLIFGSPLIEDEEIDEVVASLRTGWLGTGPKVARFEEAFRQYEGANYAAAVNSCTAAMHLSLLAAGIGPGDEVITSAMTFCSTVNVILHAGATPVLADVDDRTMNIDPEDVRAKITPRTKAILPVHFAGHACDMDALMGIANEHHLVVIEDCAHAIETTYHGRKAGTFGDFGCFSFYVTKNVATGEGGMVITPRADLADEIKIRALHGMSRDAWKRYSDEGFRHYQVVSLGFKYNMMDLQAAVGIHQLARVEQNWKIRQECWDFYQTALAESGLALPAEPEEDTRHAYHLYTVRVNEERVGISRDAFLDAMTAQGIGVGVHYLSIPEHPYYQETLGWDPDAYPVAKTIGRETVSLPISAKLSRQDREDVVEAVHRVLAR